MEIGPNMHFDGVGFSNVRTIVEMCSGSGAMIRDKSMNMLLKEVLYFPESPVNTLGGVTQWAVQNEFMRMWTFPLLVLPRATILW